jgi:hypothetical protein
VTEQAPVAAENVIASSTYRLMKQAPTIGEVRHRVWQYLIEPSSDQDPVWAARCGNYWQLQQETYGLKFSDFTFVIDWEARCVITFAVLLDVMPGERVAGYKAPRAREAMQ